MLKRYNSDNVAYGMPGGGAIRSGGPACRLQPMRAHPLPRPPVTYFVLGLVSSATIAVRHLAVLMPALAAIAATPIPRGAWQGALTAAAAMRAPAVLVAPALLAPPPAPIWLRVTAAPPIPIAIVVAAPLTLPVYAPVALMPPVPVSVAPLAGAVSVHAPLLPDRILSIVIVAPALVIPITRARACS